MKVSELMNILKKCDPSGEVLIAAKPSGTYLDFEVKEQDVSAESGGNNIIGLEATERIGAVFVTISD